jgi:hypothetical protein
MTPEQFESHNLGHLLAYLIFIVCVGLWVYGEWRYSQRQLKNLTDEPEWYQNAEYSNLGHVTQHWLRQQRRG